MADELDDSLTPPLKKAPGIDNDPMNKLDEEEIFDDEDEEEDDDDDDEDDE